MSTYIDSLLYPETIAGWKEWLEGTRYADVGRDSWIDRGYCSLMGNGLYSHLTPFLVDILFDIAIDSQVYAYQACTTVVLIGEVKTTQGIEMLDAYIWHLINNECARIYVIADALATAIKM